MNGEALQATWTRWMRWKWLGIGFVLGGLATGMVLGPWTGGVAGDPENPTGMGEMAGMPSAADGGMSMNASESSVRLEASDIRSFGITFDSVRTREVDASVRAVGVVSVDESRIVDVAPKFAGFAEVLHVDFTGAVVEPGDRLAAVYSPEVLAAQDELLLAQRLSSTAPTTVGAHANAVDLVSAARRRLRLWDLSEEQVNEVLARGTAQKTILLRAPIGGTVLEKNVVRGQSFRAGSTLYRIADLSTVWVEVEVREGDASIVREGALARVELSAFPGEHIVGRVDYIYPTFDAETRSLRTRISLPNPTGDIRPGMFATVNLETSMGSFLTVPVDALVRTGEGTFVFVFEEGRIRPQLVTTGLITGGLATILEGAEDGQVVVTSAQYLIDAEANIGAVMRSMMSMIGSGMEMGEMDTDEMDTGEMDEMEMGEMDAGETDEMDMGEMDIATGRGGN